MTSERDEWSFYAMLNTPLSKADIAALFEAAGWRSRKSGWEDHEVISADGSLIIDGSEPVLLHGPVAATPEALETVLRVLRPAAISFRGECHDGEDRLIRSFSE